MLLKTTAKNSAFFVVFLLLILFNIFIALKINKQNQRISATNDLLSDIDHAGSTYKDNKQFSTSSAPLVLGAYQANIETGDPRAANLRAIFRQQNSPLYDLADYIVKVSDQYGMDYKLLPAISIQESNACNSIPENSFNCWGWGIWPGHVTRFSSFEEGIRTVAKGLKSEYIDKGLVTPQEIMSKYNPSSNGSWAVGVSKIWGWFE